MLSILRMLLKLQGSFRDAPSGHDPRHGNSVYYIPTNET